MAHKGWLRLGIDHSDNPLSVELSVGKVSSFEMREDPDAKEYDLNKSGRDVIHDEWMDKEDLKLNYPAKVKLMKY